MRPPLLNYSKYLFFAPSNIFDKNSENIGLKVKTIVLELIVIEEILNKRRLMLLRELRFFNIYILLFDESNRNISIPLNSYNKIFELESNISPNNVKNTIYSLASTKLFKTCMFAKKMRHSIVKLEINDNIFPIMIKFKKKYLEYEFWKSLSLHSVYQIRLYETLKRYLKKYLRDGGNNLEIEISLEELKRLIGVLPKGYNNISNFKKFLSEAKYAIKKHTDIYFSYKNAGYKNYGCRKNRLYSMYFYISKNTNDNYFDMKSILTLL